jgi:hypothetical protein
MNPMKSAVNIASLQADYIRFISEHKVRPQTIKQFALAMDIEEKDFYINYTSFNEIERDIFKQYFDEAVSRLQKDATFQTFDSAEKILSFYYTWFEILSKNRAFILAIEQKKNLFIKTLEWFPVKINFLRFLAKQSYIVPVNLMNVHKRFQGFIQPILTQGLSADLAKRFWISEKYDEILWGQAVLLYRFWLNDTSEDFTRTDAAIEKSTIFLFQLLRPNSWDMGLDLAHFFVQGIKKQTWSENISKT